MPKYPKVNYIGNKEKLVDWIINEMPVKNGTVLDLFAGGGSVSYALKNAGYKVISNDILYADFVIAKSFIENDEGCILPSVFDVNVDNVSVELKRQKIDFLADRLYYPNEVDELARLITISELLNDKDKYLFLALLRRAMIRKLPYSRMNVPWNQIQLLRDEEYSYQKYKRRRAYHNQSFKSHMLSDLDDYNATPFKAQKCFAYQKDALVLADEIEPVDVVYLDPPYPSTMNNYDLFYGMYDMMFDMKCEHTDFTNPLTFLSNLEMLISKLKKKTKYIVISQNTRVKPEPIVLEEMLKRYGLVSIKERKHNYQVTGKENKNLNRELLFVLEFEQEE